MTEDCKHDGCKIAENGVCLEHGIEIERRKNSEKLSSTVQRLMLLIVCASFAYTAIVNQLAVDRAEELTAAMAKIQENSSILARQISEIAAIVNRNSDDIKTNSDGVRAAILLHLKEQGVEQK